MSAAEGWWNGKDGYRELISLDPSAKSHQSKDSNGTETAKKIEVCEMQIFYLFGTIRNLAIIQQK